MIYPCRGITWPDQTYWRRHDATDINDFDFCIGPIATYYVDGVAVNGGGPADNDPIMLRSVP